MVGWGEFGLMKVYLGVSLFFFGVGSGFIDCWLGLNLGVVFFFTVKLFMSWEDIQTDHLDVPALVFFRNSKGLSSEPPRQTWYICTVVTI